jgi:glycosyltransferase involved in cell wall biosynthesis
MRIGFVSTRFGGLDGVTLETAKLAAVAEQAGYEVAWFAGELGSGFSPGHLEPAAHFDSPANRDLQAACFGTTAVAATVRTQLEERTAYLSAALERFIEEFDVDVLVPQNSSTIPMQLPLGMATAAVIRQRRIPTVAHHHDFWWERDRFLVTAVPDVLDEAFPPDAPSVRHMVINSIARAELLKRRGIKSTVLPNVMDFEHPPPPADGAAFRAAAGIGESTLLVLQPTRIVPRKAIEDTIEIAAALSPDAVVAITHPEHDEGTDYVSVLRAKAAARDLRLTLAPVDQPGGPSLADAYAAADLVSYPSRIEGFGNALLEACYYRRPLAVRHYPVYTADIAPTGIRTAEIGDEVDTATIRRIAAWLDDSDALSEATDHNYDVCTRHFSYRAIRERFLPLLDSARRGSD